MYADPVERDYFSTPKFLHIIYSNTVRLKLTRHAASLINSEYNLCTILFVFCREELKLSAVNLIQTPPTAPPKKESSVLMTVVSV